jgi:hypothetical protein
LISIRFIYAFLARYFLLKAGARNAVGVSPLDTASRLARGVPGLPQWLTALHAPAGFNFQRYDTTACRGSA